MSQRGKVHRSVLIAGIAAAVLAASSSAAPPAAASVVGWTKVRTTANPSAVQSPSIAFDLAIGKLVLFGGLIPGQGPSAETWTFDGTGWTQLHPLIAPAPREEAAMAYDAARGNLVLFGGANGTSGGRLYGSTKRSHGRREDNPRLPARCASLLRTMGTMHCSTAS